MRPDQLRIPLAIFCLALLVLACNAALAQSERRGLVSLNVSEGRLLQLDQSVSNVLIGDHSIADVQVLSPRKIYL